MLAANGCNVVMIERRDLTNRALRNAVAGWFDIHPSSLAPLDELTIERMAVRLEGRRPHRRRTLTPEPEVGHPRAG
jgi:hypothetical protein